MDLGPTFNFCHKISTFTTVQYRSKQLEGIFAFEYKGNGQHIKDVDICHILKIKDKIHASVDSKIIRPTKDRRARVVSYVSEQWRRCGIEDQHDMLNIHHSQIEKGPDAKEQGPL